jgi:hypothetical protein
MAGAAPQTITPPPKSASEESAKRVRALISAGRKDDALLLAAELVLPLFVMTLSRDGSVDVNATSAVGLTPLLLVSQRSAGTDGEGAVLAARALLQRGANVHARCAAGMSPLGHAQQQGNTALAQLLGEY